MKYVNMKSGLSNKLLRYKIYVTNPVGDNQKYLTWTLEKVHMKSSPSNIVIICSIYLTRSHRRPSKKSLVKSGPSNMILVSSIYETRLISKQSKMFKKDLGQMSHKTRSIKYGSSMLCLLNTAQ